jgi:SPP1 family predicted phage head-tail adaptor
VTAIGELRLRLTLEAPAEADDGAGGVTRTWNAISDVWAGLTPLAMDEKNITDRETPLLKYRIALRRRDDLSEANRFRLGSRILIVRAVRDPDERGEFLECLAEEERP